MPDSTIKISVSLFDQLAVVPDLRQTSLRKVLPWAVHLSAYNYTCVHIAGEDNIWADLIGRWSHPCTIRRLVQIFVLPSSSSLELVCPSFKKPVKAQTEIENERPSNIVFSESLWRFFRSPQYGFQRVSKIRTYACASSYTIDLAVTAVLNRRNLLFRNSAIGQPYWVVSRPSSTTASIVCRRQGEGSPVSVRPCLTWHGG